MANKEIKQTIRLDGEKEYNAAIRNAQRNLKTLRSELKAETAELGANATAQQKNEAKSKSLQRQIAEQEKVVETLRRALAEANASYGDNEAVVAQWEQRLNNARATLGNMRNELEGLGQSFGDVSQNTEMGVVAAKSFADSVAGIAQMGDGVSSAIEGIFTGMIDRVQSVVETLWDMISDTAARANQWTDIAGYWNTDPTNVERWARAIEASGNSFSDFESIVSRINLGGKGKKITEMLGISDVNYEDQWAYAVAVMDRIAELTSKGEVPDDFWETVFGEKKATKAMDIVNDWESVREGLERYDAEGGGFGLDEQEMQTMNDLHVQIKGIEQDWQAIKDSVAAGFGTITGDLLFNVSGGLEAVNDILNATTEQERETAIKKLETNVRELFTKVADAIKAGIQVLNDVGEELANSDDPVVSAIGKIMKDIANSLKWMTEHADEVKHAFEVIFGVWLVGKLTAVAGKLTAIVAQIEIVKTFAAEGGFNAGAGAAGAGAGAGAGAAETAGAVGGGSVFGGLAGLMAIIGGFVAAARERLNNPEIRGSAQAVEKAAGDNEQLQNAFMEYIATNQALQEQMDQGLVDTEETAALMEKLNAVTELLNSLEGSSDLLDVYSAWRQENGYGNMQWELPDSAFFSRDDVAEQVTGISTGVTNVGTKIDQTKDEVVRVARENARWYASMLGSLTITLDGATVGRIVAPYVSGNIARAATE